VAGLDAVSLAISVVLACTCIAVIVLAVVVLVGSRRAAGVRLFGQAVHRPVLWASTMVCLGFAGLVTISSELMPRSWHRSTSVVYGVLMLAFFLLLVTHSVSLQRARRRRVAEWQARP
jgi:hypothetical protein